MNIKTRRKTPRQNPRTAGELKSQAKFDASILEVKKGMTQEESHKDDFRRAKIHSQNAMQRIVSRIKKWRQRHDG